MPITLVAHIEFHPEKNNAVSGIVSFMRNIGSSVGTSLVTTLLARRAQFHQEVLVNHISAGNPRLKGAAMGLSQRLANSGSRQARGAIDSLRQNLPGRSGAGERRGVY